MKATLLVVDLQKAYHNGADAVSMDSACYFINAALPAFHAKGLPVIWVRHVDEDDGAVEGQPGFDLIDQLKPEPGEARIAKRYNNAFNKTELGSILEKEGVDTVVISGYCAEWCILSTYRGCLDRDLTPVLLRGGVASGDAANLAFVEKLSALVSPSFLTKAL